MRRVNFLIKFLVLISLHSSIKSEDENSRVNALLSDYFQWKIQTFAFDYYLKGFNENAGKLPDLSLDNFQRIKEKCGHFHDRADELLRQKVVENTRDLRYVKVLKREAQICSKGGKFHAEYLAPVSFMDGVQTQLPNYFKGENVLKTDSLSDYKDILKLLEGIPKYLQQIQILLQKGIENKLTFHKASMSRIKAQFEKLMDFGKIEDCIFYTPFQKLMGNSEAVENIKEEAKRTIHHKVIPAFEKLQSYLFDEYFMHLREFPGISSLDDDIYQAYLEYYTTIEGITPEEIHNIGLDEVAKLKSEMMTVVKNELGHNNMSFLELAEMLKDDTNQLFESKEEIIEYYQDVIQQAMGKIGQFFDEKVLNNDTYNINFKQVPPGGGGLAYYWGPTVDGRRLGAFFLNTQNLKANRKFEVNSLTLHESIPGHHLQFSFNKKSPIPPFLRYGIDKYQIGQPPVYFSHFEGWGLYAESMGFEMGLYEDPYQKLGFYSWNLLRASRLVVDTGIHAFGWGRQRAIDYLLENTLMSKHNAEGQIDRYITWPGQATSYKIGELQIQKLRKKRQEELGKDFDLSKFHRHILTCLGPIEMLEECVKEEEKLPFPTKPRNYNYKRDPKSIQNGGNISKISTSLILFLLIICKYI